MLSTEEMAEQERIDNQSVDDWIFDYSGERPNEPEIVNDEVNNFGVEF